MKDCLVMFRVVKMSSPGDLEVFAIDTQTFAIIPSRVLVQLSTDFLACTEMGETDTNNRVKLYQDPDGGVWVRAKDIIVLREVKG